MFGRVVRGFAHHWANLSDTGTCVCTVLNNHWLLYQHLNLRFAITLTAAPHNEVHKNSRWILPFEAAPSGYRKHACAEVQQIKTVYAVVCWTDSFAMRSFMKTNGLFIKVHKGYKATYSNVYWAEVRVNSPCVCVCARACLEERGMMGLDLNMQLVHNSNLFPL